LQLTIKLSIAKLLELLGDFVLHTPNWGFAPEPHWGNFHPRTSYCITFFTYSLINVAEFVPRGKRGVGGVGHNGIDN
jgi:hypothetical protein